MTNFLHLGFTRDEHGRLRVVSILFHLVADIRNPSRRRHWTMSWPSLTHLGGDQMVQAARNLYSNSNMCEEVGWW